MVFYMDCCEAALHISHKKVRSAPSVSKSVGSLETSAYKPQPSLLLHFAAAVTLTAEATQDNDLHQGLQTPVMQSHSPACFRWL